MEAVIRRDDGRIFIVPWTATPRSDGHAFTRVIDWSTSPPTCYWCIFLDGDELLRSRIFTDGIECTRSLKEAVDANPHIDARHVSSSLAVLEEHEAELRQDANFLMKTGIRRKRMSVHGDVEKDLEIPSYAKWVRIINHSSRTVTVYIPGDPPVLIVPCNPAKADIREEDLSRATFHRPDGVRQVKASSEGSLLIVDWSPEVPGRLDRQ